MVDSIQEHVPVTISNVTGSRGAIVFNDCCEKYSSAIADACFFKISAINGNDIRLAPVQRNLAVIELKWDADKELWMGQYNNCFHLKYYSPRIAEINKEINLTLD